jgi:hypothetical protein
MKRRVGCSDAFLATCTLYDLLDTLDEASLVAQRLTVPFIRSVLKRASPRREPGAWECV